MNREWRVSLGREGMRYVVQRLVFSDWAGSGYKFARVNGRVARFWTRRGAQWFADNLNAQQAKGE